MKRKLAILVLAALGSLAVIAPVLADNDQPTDYEVAVKATDADTLDYNTIKERLFKRYAPIVERMEQGEKGYTSIFTGSADDTAQGAKAIPQNFTPWWQNKVDKRINTKVTDLSTDVTSLFTRAVKHSSQIQVFSDLPLIRETTIQEANGPYDFRLFAEGHLTDLNEPVGDLTLIDIANFSDYNLPLPMATSSITQTAATSQQILIDGSISIGGQFHSAFPLWDGTERILISW